MFGSGGKKRANASSNCAALKQEDLPSRAEAFRRLIELGLSAKKTGPKVKT
jgi:hypothetical protein